MKSRRPKLKGIFAAGVCALLALPLAAQQDKRTDATIAFFQQKVKQDPDDFSNYNRLATAYLQKARESGDLTYFELAQKAVERSLNLESSHDAAARGFAIRATVLYSEHRFADSASDAEHALALEPQDLAMHATAGDAYLEQGEYEKARAHYAKLVSERHSPALEYLRLTREAGLELALAQPQWAIAPLQQAIKLTEEFSLPAENRAWTEFTLAEAQLLCGDVQSAEIAIRASLAAFPNYHRANAALGQLRTMQKRYPEAIAAYRNAISVIPLPAYVAALGDVYAKTGNNTEAEKQYKLVEVIAGLSSLGKTVYSRELALFYADHDRQIPRALEMLTSETKQRHDLYTLDALAWAQYKAGDTKQALLTLAKVDALQPRDPIVLYHSAVVRGSEEGNASTELLHRAMEINSEFHVFFAADAAKRLSAASLAKVAR